MQHLIGFTLGVCIHLIVSMKKHMDDYNRRIAVQRARCSRNVSDD